MKFLIAESSPELTGPVIPYRTPSRTPSCKQAHPKKIHATFMARNIIPSVGTKTRPNSTIVEPRSPRLNFAERFGASLEPYFMLLIPIRLTLPTLMDQIGMNLSQR